MGNSGNGTGVSGNFPLHELQLHKIHTVRNTMMQDKN